MSCIEVHLSHVPHIALVVFFLPDGPNQTILEQVNIEAYCIYWAIHMVPELQTLRTSVGTLGADETSCVTIDYAMGLNIKVTASWGWGGGEEDGNALDFSRLFFFTI